MGSEESGIHGKNCLICSVDFTPGEGMVLAVVD